VRLPFPERVSYTIVCAFAIVLCTIQIYQQTAPLFSLCCFFFIIVAAIAFNVAGGMTRPSGAYIFFFSVLAVIIGLCWKAILGEPADSNLTTPILTSEVYLGSICSMLVAAFISKRFTTKEAFLARFVTDNNLQTATIGCLVTGLVIDAISTVVPQGTASFLSALRQINHFYPMVVFLGTIHAIRRSGGTRSISFPVLLAGGLMFVEGVLGFSKEGMITPGVAWVLAVAAQRYKLSVGQIAGMILATVFLFYYLIPYSQYGRNFQTQSRFENINTSFSMLGSLGTVRRDYEESQSGDVDEELAQGYFTLHQGFFDRLQMIGPDDGLIAFTEQGVVPGLTPVYLYFVNLIPHFIWKNKPSWGGGNLYARQMGYLPDTDETTGISFSPASESYHVLRWTGTLILLPILWIMLFTLFDSLCGDVRKSPWGLLMVLAFAHTAPEGGLGGMIYVMGYGTLGLFFTAITATYLMPILGDIVVGPNSKMVGFRDPLRINPRETIASQRSAS
jgi:hypothetical protein